MTLREKLLSDRTKLVEARAVDAEERAVTAIANDFSVKGLGRSGGLVEARHERRLNTLHDVIAERLRLEETQPLGSEDISTWYDAVVVDVRNTCARGRERLVTMAESDWKRSLGSDLPGDVRARIEQGIDQLEQEYLAEAQLLRQARRSTGSAPPTGITMVTININQSQVAGLNLGNVVGNIQATVTGLNAVGAHDLAEALKSLTEAIAEAPSLPPGEKREAVELVSALAEELAKPREEVRAGLLRTVSVRLGQLISGAGTAYSAYEAVKFAARALGFELP